MSPQAEALIALLQRRVVWQATGAVMVSWFFGYYGFGFWWGLWLVPLFYTWERIHSRRFVRQQVQKYADLVQERDEPEIESVEWINRMMRIAWPTMGPYISDIIMDKSAEALDANKPMMVSRMCLEGVTMGLAPPVINDVIVYKSDANVLDIECTINFDSQIAMEMAAYTKPARVPILVKEPQFNARSRVTAWLIPREPFLSQMRVSFLERPDIDVTVKPISVGPDVINLVPGLSGAIKDMFIGMFSDQWIHPKFLEIVLEQPEGDEPLKVTVEEKQHKKGVIAGGVGAVGALGASGAGLVGSGVGMVGSGAAGATKAVGAGVGKVGAVGANTTKAVGGAAVGGAKAVGGAAAAGIGSVGKLGSSGVSAFSGGVNKVNPFAKKKSSDADGAKKDKKDKKESSSSGFGFGFGKKKEKKKTAADSESARELSATEEASEEAAAAAPETERSKKSLLGFGRTKSSKKVADDESTKEPSAAEEASEGSEKRRHKKHKGDSERKHKKHRKHREHGDDEDASEASEASEGGDEDRTERSERKRKTRRKKDGEEKKHKHTHKHHHDEEKEEEKEPSEDALHHLADSVSDGLSALNPFGKKKKKEKATKD